MKVKPYAPPTVQATGICTPHFWQVLMAAANPQHESVLSAISGSRVRLDWTQEDERSRRVVKRSNYRMTGKFPSDKAGRMVQWESRIELDALRVLETHPAVKSFREQPALVRWTDAEAERRHYPDLKVDLYGAAPLLVEVKSDKEAHERAIQERTKFLSAELRKYGLRYLLVTSSQVSGIPQDNAQYILKHAAKKLDPTAAENIRRALFTPMTLANLEAELGEQIRAIVIALIRRGDIIFDAGKKLCGATELSWGKGK
jgi:hypothetical protein